MGTLDHERVDEDGRVLGVVKQRIRESELKGEGRF